MKTILKNFKAKPVSATCFGFALIVLFITGCAANRSRYTPITAIQPDLLNLQTESLPTIHVILFNSTHTVIKGGHHEGLLQVRQPWIFGLSMEQKDVLYGNAGPLAALAFAAELVRQGMPVVLHTSLPDDRSLVSPLLLTGTVDTIDLNTYGRGTVEGFGSAGDYWEAMVKFTNLALRDMKREETIWSGDIQSYAKLSDSPAKLDWTMLTVAKKALQEALLLHSLSTGTIPMSIVRDPELYIKEEYGADYSMAKYKVSPVEVAARFGAVKLLKEITTRFPISGE